MIDKINAPLRALAGRLNKNLYLVGGCVRNYLIDGKLSGDFDLASANTESELLAAFGGDFAPVAVYPRTGTVMFKDRAGTHYEHTAFRGEEYEKGGGHTPARTYFTEDIAADAVRRDFKCNAVYYDLKNAVYADPLGGVADIKNKTLAKTFAAVPLCGRTRVCTDEGSRRGRKKIQGQYRGYRARTHIRRTYAHARRRYEIRLFRYKGALYGAETLS